MAFWPMWVRDFGAVRGEDRQVYAATPLTPVDMKDCNVDMAILLSRCTRGAKHSAGTSNRPRSIKRNASYSEALFFLCLLLFCF